MLMPTLSVTLIGLVVGMVGGFAGRQPLRGVGLGIVGAWIGFAAGGVLGLAFDVMAQTGSGVAIAGHLGAFAGSVVALGVGTPAWRRITTLR